MIWACIKYFGAICRHKQYVFQFGLKTKAPIYNLIVHDWSKFSPSEFFHYARWFYGPKDNQQQFMVAVLHHKNYNPHHWEYWINRGVHALSKVPAGPLPMPEQYVREMVADWMAASISYSGKKDLTDWLKKNLPTMELHSTTQVYLSKVLAAEGYDWAWRWTPAAIEKNGPPTE